MTALKLIITSKANLKMKYGNKFSSLQKLFSKLIKADKKKKLDTKIVYVDDSTSTKKFGVSAISSITEKNCKDIFDQLYKKNQPAYMVIFGAQDVFPFQNLENELYDPDPDKDNDKTVPSDLPYACEKAYNKKISAFTNPARVVGRIPDLPGTGDINYVKVLIEDNIKHKEGKKDDYMDYFAVTAYVWRKSTQQSIQNIFGNNKKLFESPPAGGGYASKLKPLTHFYNLHGAEFDTRYFGQKGTSFPTALNSTDLEKKITYGTVVAAECCYGSQLLDPSESGMSIANNYLYNHALSFMGSTTIAYGPPDGQGLADLICQYFVKNIHEGASAGRALLEARHKFLNVNGPTLDAHELKTLAQFHLLGDPSITLIQKVQPKDVMNTIENRRMSLFNKGISIGKIMAPCKKVLRRFPSRHKKKLNEVLKEAGFADVKKETIFETAVTANQATPGMKKAFAGGKTRFRTYQKSGLKYDGVRNIKALVVKENDEQVLGWKIYVSR
jgi:hypothetical protein